MNCIKFGYKLFGKPQVGELVAKDMNEVYAKLSDMFGSHATDVKQYGSYAMSAEEYETGSSVGIDDIPDIDVEKILD